MNPRHPRLLGLVLAPALALLPLAAPAAAQDDEGYAWGEEGGGTTGTSALGGEDPLRVQATVGAGVGFRLLRNLDFDQEFILPPYLDVGAAVFLPGTDLRHGGGVAVSTIMTGEADTEAFQQWVLTPSYHLLLPLQRVAGMDQDVLQVQVRAGVPIVFTHVPLSDPNVTIGGELAAALFAKFLAGLGAYLEVQGAIYGGYDFTFHPVVSVDAGLVLDYEFLP